MQQQHNIAFCFVLNFKRRIKTLFIIYVWELYMVADQLGGKKKSIIEHIYI